LSARAKTPPKNKPAVLRRSGGQAAAFADRISAQQRSGLDAESLGLGLFRLPNWSFYAFMIPRFGPSRAFEITP
jgi:hypothetical protein